MIFHATLSFWWIHFRDLKIVERLSGQMIRWLTKPVSIIYIHSVVSLTPWFHMVFEDCLHSLALHQVLALELMLLSQFLNSSRDKQAMAITGIFLKLSASVAWLWGAFRCRALVDPACNVEPNRFFLGTFTLWKMLQLHANSELFCWICELM